MADTTKPKMGIKKPSDPEKPMTPATLPSLLSQRAALQSSSNVWDIAVLFFAVVVAVGIVGEVICSVGSVLKHFALQANERSVDAERGRIETEKDREAEAKVAALEHETETLKASNITLQTNLDREKNDRLILLQQASVRAIWQKPQVDLLLKAFRKFPKQSIKLEYIRDNAESWDFACDLLGVLSDAGIPPKGYPQLEGFPHPTTSPDVMPLQGFIVLAGNKVPENDLTELTNALIYARAAGDAVSMSVKRSFRSGQDTNEVTIIVGLNPNAGPKPLGFWERLTHPATNQ
jgi:hypothetical protein